MVPSLGLDHIYLRVHDLDAVLAFFQLRLGLPVTWPVRDEPFARYAWVNGGNVQIEIWQARSNEDLPPGSRLPLVAGLALWPADVHESRRALALKGVSCKQPRPWRTLAADGAELNFTNCMVLDATGPACQVFFCEWSPNAPIAPWPNGESTAQWRARLAKALTHATSNTIGIEGLCAIHLQTPDPAESARVWNAITGDSERVAPDVALLLEEGPDLQIMALVFCVRDPRAASAALEQRALRCERHGDVHWLDREQTFGMRVGLRG